MTTVPKSIAGVSAIADLYDLFVLDQFGVLHDGGRPYPGVLACLNELKHRGKKTVILSNSGKRSAENESRLEQLGFTNRPWDLFVSSGEVAWRQLASSGVSQTCYLISRDHDLSAIDALPVIIAATPEDADIILLTASEGDRFELSHYQHLLSRAAERAIPCLCTNPDRIMLTQSGHRFGAGRIAELYESMGGPVTYVGKPYPAIYQAALTMMGNPDKSRVICVGDSIEHDITGAFSSGLSSALVSTGIHAGASKDELANEFNRHKAQPDFILPSLIW
jgi:HAD superfamily hydrolase (TIGR01459 family)